MGIPIAKGDDCGAGSEATRCTGRTATGAGCRSIGHWIEQGARFCVSHKPEGAVKEPIYCVARLRDGSACRSFATRIMSGALGVHALCPHHGALYEETGRLQGEPRKRDRAPDVVKSDEVERLELRAQRTRERRSAPTGGASIKERVFRTADDAYTEMEGLLQRAIQGARRKVRFNCRNCGHVNSVEVEDFSVGLKAIEMLLSLTTSRPRPEPDEEAEIAALRKRESPLTDWSTEDLARLAHRNAATEPITAQNLPWQVQFIQGVFGSSGDEASAADRQRAAALLETMGVYLRALEPIRKLTPLR